MSCLKKHLDYKSDFSSNADFKRLFEMACGNEKLTAKQFKEIGAAAAQETYNLALAEHAWRTQSGQFGLQSRRFGRSTYDLDFFKKEQAKVHHAIMMLSQHPVKAVRTVIPECKNQSIAECKQRAARLIWRFLYEAYEGWAAASNSDGYTEITEEDGTVTVVCECE